MSEFQKVKFWMTKIIQNKTKLKDNISLEYAFANDNGKTKVITIFPKSKGITQEKKNNSETFSLKDPFALMYEMI